MIPSYKLWNRVCHSPKRWTDGDIALLWLVKDFDEQTKENA
jgi:hypothetical protein